MTANKDAAEKELFRFVGKCKKLDFDDFYKLFCKGIFRIALIDMINTIEEVNRNFSELPLTIKLASYRRNLLLSGLQKESSEI